MEEDRMFDENALESLLRRCGRLKREGKIHAGVEYYIEGGKLHVRTLKPQIEVPGKAFNLDVFLQETSSSIQKTRHALSEVFDVTATAWNDSAIGRLLKFVSDEFREGTYETEEARKRGSVPVHNIYRYIDLSHMITEVGAIILDKKLQSKKPEVHFAILNEVAQKELSKFRRKAEYMQASALVEVVLGLGELYKLRPGQSTLRKTLSNIIPEAEEIVGWFEKSAAPTGPPS